MPPVVHCNEMDYKNYMNKILLWNKKLNDFIPIISTHNMSGYKESYINPEQRNMKGINVRLAYNPIIKILEAKNNGTEITGLFGDLWDLVGNHLNLTASLKTTREYHNASVPRGRTQLIVSLMESNQLDIVIPSDYHQNTTNFIEYLSFISDCYRLYVPPSFESNDKWIFKLVTYDVLLLILAIMLFMSILNFLIEKHTARYNNMNNAPISLCDYFFQTFATFVNQGSLPHMYQGNWSRIMTLTRSMLAFLFLTMSTAYLFSLMSKKSIHEAFTDILSFLEKSNMNLRIRATSPGWSELLAGVSSTAKLERIEIVDKIYEMYRGVGHCNNITLWQADIVQRTVGYMHKCHLVPATSCLTRNHVFLGISRKFHYKRSLAVGIMKVRESGFIDIAKQRWLSPPISFADDKYQNVRWEEVRTIFFIYLIGVIMSVIFLVIEKIVVIRQHHRLRKEINQQRRRIALRLKREQKY